MVCSRSDVSESESQCENNDSSLQLPEGSGRGVSLAESVHACTRRNRNLPRPMRMLARYLQFG